MNPIYKQRIYAALDYIEAHLAEHLSLEVIARHCHFSPFHFHRIFKGAMNETLNNYIARKRLEKAANLLVFKRDISITAIAYDCGFSSSANFSKAIKQYFGYTPKEIREPRSEDVSRLGRIFDRYGKSFAPYEMYPNSPAECEQTIETLKVEVKNITAKRLAKLKSNGGYEPKALFDTWDRLIQWAQEHSKAGDYDYRLAWCYDNPAVTPLEKCRYEASIEVDTDTTIIDPFFEGSLPEGVYATLYIKGSAEDIEQAQKYMFSRWLPNSRYEPDNIPMLEHYLNDVRVDGFIETEILLKLKLLN